MSKAIKVRDLLDFTPLEILYGLTTNLNVLYEDNVVINMSYKEIIIQRYLMELYKVIPYIPIESKQCISNFYSNGYFTSKVIANYFTTVLSKIVELQELDNRFDRYVMLNNNNPLYLEIFNIVNNIYNDIVCSKIEYSGTVDIMDYMEIQFKDKLIEAIKEVDINKNKQSIDNAYNVLEDIIKKDKDIQNNNIVKSYLSGSINPSQAKQLLGPRGYLTEINSVIYKEPIASSFILGMNSIYDLAIESRAAAKALYLSTNAVTTSEYLARQLQLVTMLVEKLVDGDCGSKNYLEWYVRPESEYFKSDIDNLLGKYYLNEETGKEEAITKKHKYLEGKTIKLRSVINCILPNPRHVCLKCFGQIGYAIPYHSNIGHYCTTAVSKELTQSILSTKHLAASANNAHIKIHTTNLEYVYAKSGCYYLQNNKKYKTVDRLELHIKQREAFGLKDIFNINNISKISVDRMSRIETISIIGYKEDTQVIAKQIPIKEGKRYGSFTVEMLNHIRDVKYIIDDSNNYIIDITNFNIELPIIIMPDLEFSFLDLTNSFHSVFKTMHTKVPEELIRNTFDLVNSKLSINISLLEVVAYAFSIIDKNTNFNLPRNTNTRETVSIQEAITHRSIGASYGWERLLNVVILSPRAFAGNNAIKHPMDVIIKPQEVITLEDNN